MSFLDGDDRPKRVVNIEPHVVEAKCAYRDGAITLTFIASRDQGRSLNIVRVKGDRLLPRYLLEQLKEWAVEERKRSAEATEGL
jgi:hypothetical protein